MANGNFGVRNVRPTTFVLTRGPAGTPDGTSVAVDGEPDFLVTGSADSVEVGQHLFELTSGGRKFRRKRFCPGGHSAANPFVVDVDLPADAGDAAVPMNLPQAAPAQRTTVRALRSENPDASPAVAKGVTPEVQTIVYVHGIGNKPTASVVKCQWDTALFGNSLGDRSRMAYWVNREYYPVPTAASCAAADTVDVDDDEATTNAVLALAGVTAKDQAARDDEAVHREVEALSREDAERAEWLRRVAGRMKAANVFDDAAIREEHESRAAQIGTLRTATAAPDVPYEEIRNLASLDREALGYSARVLPLPAFLRRLVTSKLTRAFLRDVSDFFFDEARRTAMTRSLAERLNAGGGPFVIIAHSQGSMVAYEVLRHLRRQDCTVKLFVTIGSPLGMQEVQDMFRRWEPGGMKVPACVDRWVNVADRLDPVAVDSDISNDVAPRGKVAVENFRAWGLNEDSPRHPHSGTGYLLTRYVQDAVRGEVGHAFGQAVGRSIIARDLTDQIEDSLHDTPHRTLIELASEGGQHGPVRTLADTKERLVAAIGEMVAARPENVSRDAKIDALKRFVAADLTRLEVEKLRTLFTDLAIQRVWRNAEKASLINESTNTVQARTANIGYRATGKGICWAVLDTGIAAGHPHFRPDAAVRTVAAQWDCTLPGDARQVDPKRDDKAFAKLDRNGHGTHVSGIIAGGFEAMLDDAPESFSGVAPETTLYGFKVLDDQGRGHDSYIIKALDKIADLNDGAGQLVVHGVNLSLGGSFDPSVYGCGHTPLCQELRRLWRQGVVVVLAAGNEGYALLQSSQGNVPANMDLSIGDPANLDEAIAVGSVHKRNPHTFGISYFSSRGPTADGRVKPDLVAPGEQILSAFHDYPARRGVKLANQLYVEMSGTSMAAPHVSGVLAAFLSVRREFIGYPDKVKQILLANCTDLGRDRYIQGAGMPNLVQMLATT